MRARTCCCDGLAIRPHRLVAVLTGVQVIRALWEIWGCVDNKWPSSINPWMMPVVYTSCLLSICMMVTSACATWSVYKAHVRSLKINWWIYYGFTVLAFINSSGLLSIMCVSKDRYIAGCISDNRTGTVEIIPACIRMWEESVVWTAVGSIATVVINITFAYLLYRVKSQHPYHGSSSDNTDGRRTAPVMGNASLPPSYYHSNTRTTDEDGFQDIELK